MANGLDSRSSMGRPITGNRSERDTNNNADPLARHSDHNNNAITEPNDQRFDWINDLVTNGDNGAINGTNGHNGAINSTNGHNGAINGTNNGYNGITGGTNGLNGATSGRVGGTAYSYDATNHGINLQPNPSCEQYDLALQSKSIAATVGTSSAYPKKSMTNGSSGDSVSNFAPEEGMHSKSVSYRSQLDLKNYNLLLEAMKYFNFGPFGGADGGSVGAGNGSVGVGSGGGGDSFGSNGWERRNSIDGHQSDHGFGPNQHTNGYNDNDRRGTDWDRHNYTVTFGGPLNGNGRQKHGNGHSNGHNGHSVRHRTPSVSEWPLGDRRWTAHPDQFPDVLRNESPKSKAERERIDEILRRMLGVSMTATATYSWTGQLPPKRRSKNPIYSCKVFLGGIPYDLTDGDLHCTFAPFGPIQIQWPGKEVKSPNGNGGGSGGHDYAFGAHGGGGGGGGCNKAGYVYVIFESYDNVAALLKHCTISYRDLDMGLRYYYNVSSRRQKAKEVQVIPFDIGDRFYMKNTFSGQMEHSRTVFVGALHGMLAAEGLAKVMDDLFGGVVFAGLDTDKHKYPLGSGRVSFDNQDSYLRAVSAAFIEIKAARFRKKIQIDPYIENESVCAVCRRPQQTPIFCRDDFKYFCIDCWECHIRDPDCADHRPIVKNRPATAAASSGGLTVGGL